MRVTAKGQVTIPKAVREALGITPETEIDFVEEQGRFYLVRVEKPRKSGRLRRLRGIASAGMSTDEILRLTRETE